MVDLNRLHALKQKLLHDVKLPPVMDFFMTHFGDHPEFMAMSDITRHEFLEWVVEAIAQKLWPRNSAIRELKLVTIPEHKFYHGSYFAGGRLGMVIYYEEEDVGLAAICEGPPSNEVKYARFSKEPLKRRGDPEMN